MRNSRTVVGKRTQSRALVPQKQGRAVVIRNSSLAVRPPREIALSTKPDRFLSKLLGYSFLASFFAFAGFALGDSQIRGALDYHATLLFSSGVTDIPAVNRIDAAERLDPLPDYLQPLFNEGRKGPRADRLAFAMKGEGNDSIA